MYRHANRLRHHGDITESKHKRRGVERRGKQMKIKGERYSMDSRVD